MSFFILFFEIAMLFQKVTEGLSPTGQFLIGLFGMVSALWGSVFIIKRGLMKKLENKVSMNEFKLTIERVDSDIAKNKEIVETQYKALQTEISDVKTSVGKVDGKMDILLSKHIPDAD